MPLLFTLHYWWRFILSSAGHDPRAGTRINGVWARVTFQWGLKILMFEVGVVGNGCVGGSVCTFVCVVLCSCEWVVLCVREVASELRCFHFV